MDKVFNIIVEKDRDGFYVSQVPSLHGCHTQAKSLDELLTRTKEVIELCLEVENIPFKQNDFEDLKDLRQAKFAEKNVDGMSLSDAEKEWGLKT
ncbi:MAG: hypothetical protein DRQ51_07845 [Gammaproteobacteria bacterium]|nr:MAG: hypothetical protein DRQ51_07845 [Gammaproteobacteria bacterium]